MKTKHWVVVLGVLGYFLYASRQRDYARGGGRSPAPVEEELMRWEDEGGNVVPAPDSSEAAHRPGPSAL